MTHDTTTPSDEQLRALAEDVIKTRTPDDWDEAVLARAVLRYQDQLTRYQTALDLIAVRMKGPNYAPRIARAASAGASIDSLHKIGEGYSTKEKD